MTDWIDLALMANEEDLTQAIDGLSAEARKETLGHIASFLSSSPDDIDRMMLRLMVERVRPFALPQELWARPIEASSDIVAAGRAHFNRLGISATPQRLEQVQKMYAQFAIEKRDARVTKPHLDRQNYRCGHCGLAFCNEELVERGIVSPFGSRGKPKTDPLKIHWSADRYRLPTMDHVWPIALYGSNEDRNLLVLCQACNEGKAGYLALEQMRPSIGLPTRPQFVGKLPVPSDLFYAQIRRAPSCHRTDKTAADSELTVILRDPLMVPVLDNLLTVESPGI